MGRKRKESKPSEQVDLESLNWPDLEPFEFDLEPFEWPDLDFDWDFDLEDWGFDQAGFSPSPKGTAKRRKK